jgi:hypothetical protein
LPDNIKLPYENMGSVLRRGIEELMACKSRSKLTRSKGSPPKSTQPIPTVKKSCINTKNEHR